LSANKVSEKANQAEANHLEPENTTIELTAEIVANYVSNNSISIEQLPELIRTVNKTLCNLGQPEVSVEPETDKPTAAQIRKSIRPDGLVSFIDGKSYKTLKRHLSRHGLSILEYKAKFGLPKDYPTTSPEYSAKRSEMARSLGLGRQRAASGDTAAKPRKTKS
jgi:predicted transcriptional regulator